ncbi:hypothetical protein JKG47_19245 [Acidithiobacillus sp. MC6.1]|nr:hypothetical protein [Acidithiobacillus sp. MC6.1]
MRHSLIARPDGICIGVDIIPALSLRLPLLRAGRTGLAASMASTLQSIVFFTH